MTTLFYFLVAICFSFFRVQLFFPLLAVVALRKSRIRALWIAAAAGFYFDLLAADHFLGLRALLFILTMAFLYSYKKFVSEEKCLPFCLYSMLFGLFCTLALGSVQTFGPPYFVWSFEFFLVDLLLLPLCDSLIGWLLFIAPQTVLRFLKRSLLRLKKNG